MLSKEEIEKSIEDKYVDSEEENFGLTIEEAKHIVADEDEMNYCDILIEAANKILLKYIEQLETDKQKLIEKLEEDINVDKIQWYDELGRIVKEEPKSMFVSRKIYAQEILSILKGENE